MIAWIATIVGAYTLMRCIEIYQKDDVEDTAKTIAVVTATVIAISLGMCWKLQIEAQRELNQIQTIFSTFSADSHSQAGRE